MVALNKLVKLPSDAFVASLEFSNLLFCVKLKTRKIRILLQDTDDPVKNCVIDLPLVHPLSGTLNKFCGRIGGKPVHVDNDHCPSAKIFKAKFALNKAFVQAVVPLTLDKKDHITLPARTFQI